MSFSAREESPPSSALSFLCPSAFGSWITDTTVFSSSWTATDRCSNVTEITKCRSFSHEEKNPYAPDNGPVSTWTNVPSGMYAQGLRKRSLRAKSCNASISFDATSACCPPNSTIRVTPGVIIALPAAEGVKRQKIYDGKIGNSSSTTRSDHCRFCRYIGKKHS